MYARKSLGIIIIKIYLKFQADINGAEGKGGTEVFFGFLLKMFLKKKKLINRR